MIKLDDIYCVTCKYNKLKAEINNQVAMIDHYKKKLDEANNKEKQLKKEFNYYYKHVFLPAQDAYYKHKTSELEQ